MNPNATFKVAESRLFPIGNPALFAGGLAPNPLSPFDGLQFSNSLIPLVSATIRENLKNIAPAIKGKVNEAAAVFNEGFDLVEDTIRQGWRESPLNPYNYERYLNRPNIFKPLVGGHPAYHKHHPKFPHHKKEKPSDTVSYSVDNMMHDYGINGYKHFEESILKELEKQEELKVEATIHTLFNQGEHVEIVKGKNKEIKSGWRPIAAPTKTYDDNNDITSQIVSPLHTSIFSLSDAASESPDKLPALGFHDFDSLNASPYSVFEEAIESKVKPVKAKIASIKRITPMPPVYATRSTTTTTTTTAFPIKTSRSRVPTAASHHRKRHNHNSLKTAGEEIRKSKDVVDSSTSESNEVPTVISKVKPLRVHVQSLTTSKPKNHSNIDRDLANTIQTFNYESTSRFRIPSSTTTTTTTTIQPLKERALKFATFTTTTTTMRPRTVPREALKFVDRARTSGFRGSIKYGQSTTKDGDKN